MPTMNTYMQQVGADPKMFGMAIAIFSFARMFSSTAVGSIADWFGFRTAYAVTISAGIAAGFMYTSAAMFPFSIGAGMIFAARALQGFGSSNTVLTKAHFYKSINMEEAYEAAGDAGVQAASKVLKSWVSLYAIARMAGLLFGPGFNVFLSRADFSVGPLDVSCTNVQGIFVAGLLSLVAAPLLYTLKEPEHAGEPMAQSELFRASGSRLLDIDQEQVFDLQVQALSGHVKEGMLKWARKAHEGSPITGPANYGSIQPTF